MHNTTRALALALPLALFACNHHDDDHKQPGEQEQEGEHGHTHAPLIEGGSLTELGDHEGNLEVHLNPATGELTVYLVDGHASDYVRSSQESLLVDIQPEKGEPFALTLGQVASSLSGEKVGDSSKYQVKDDRLKGLADVDGKVKSVSLKGATYTDVAIEWPAGDHDH